MAGYPVTGDQYRTIDRRMSDIKRQLNVADGSPLDPQAVMDALQDIVEGHFGTAAKGGLRRLIDCDASPWCPRDWKVEKHKRGGQLEFDPSKVELYLSKSQQGERTIEGHKLRKEFKGKQMMNACVLDHLLANTGLIPEGWKKDERGRPRHIYFWDTVYRVSSGGLYARCLCWVVDGWSCFYNCLDDQWNDSSPAAVSAS